MPMKPTAQRLTSHATTYSVYRPGFRKQAEFITRRRAARFLRAARELQNYVRGYARIYHIATGLRLEIRRGAVMTRIQAISANRSLLRTWLEDSDGEHDAATDRALAGLLEDGSGEYALTPELARDHASMWRDEYPHVAEVLRQLADKLHEIPSV